jgi:perosamine synthetase
VAVNSCTAALHLALAAKEFEKGDKFIAPTYTFVATVEVGEYSNMSPVLIDCDENYNIDLNHVEHSLKKDRKIKCIIPVHFAGRPINMAELRILSEKYGVFIIEDAAHALEAISNVGKVGDTNDAACFSFYANKNITTAGEGGAISTNNDQYAEKIRKLSLHGMSKDGWNRFAKGGKWAYDISELGFKYNLTDIAAAFGIWQLKYIDTWHNRRSDIVKFYNNKFNKVPGILCPIITKNIKNANHLYIVRIKPDLWNIDRNTIINKLNKRGIGTSVHYIPIHMHSYYIQKYGYKASDFPKAKSFCEKVITLPLYPLLSDIELDYVANNFMELWHKYKKE